MNTDRTLLNKARVLLGLEVKLEQMKLDNGAILEAEVFEAGAEIFVVADDERVAVPVGEYEVEGKTIIVSEEGIIGEIKEAGSEEEAPAETEAEEVQVELSEEVKEEKVELSAEEVEGITHTPENLSNKKELNLYSQKGNKNTTRNRIFNKINK